MPIISLAVVIKGPVANAGSIFILFSKIGIVEPTVAEKQTTINREKPELKARNKSLVKYQDIKPKITEQTIPFKKATLNSFQSLTIISVVCIAPVARPRTTMEED